MNNYTLNVLHNYNLYNDEKHTVKLPAICEVKQLILKKKHDLTLPKVCNGLRCVI